MEETTDAVVAGTDEDLAREIRETAEQEQVPRDRATRFYDRIRNTIRSFVEGKGKVLGKTAEFLLLVPDVFILLWRLTTDSRVNSKDKLLLGSAVVYFISPFDLIPEAIVGPIGYLDDLVFGVFVLNKILGSVDVSIVREHWSGSEDVLHAIQRVLGAADSLIGKDMVAKIKRMMGK
ncbi:MAG TPA: YkvA family protein [Thermoanaerobaculia bacterium]|jgi:uncharacterized membrane protein YkvA (DUF1232 family)|nr:YkvA family protein [Thermoanaerobaculia bacterium]